jgi:hypothetical protein
MLNELEASTPLISIFMAMFVTAVTRKQFQYSHETSTNESGRLLFACHELNALAQYQEYCNNANTPEI